MNHELPGAAIGIDVGGTAIKGGLVETDGSIIERRTNPTRAEEGVEYVLRLVARMISELAERAELLGRRPSAVGIGVPGTIRHREGIVQAPPNLPGWLNVPIRSRLHELCGYTIVLENDANAAAVGEYLCGAGRGVRDMVMLTLGTGVGGGIIADGKLFRGELENAGELGHMIVVPNGRTCGCRQNGCLETYASATQTAARLEERIRAGEQSSLSGRVREGREVRAEDVASAAEQGDQLASEVWQETCLYLAIGCINIQHMLNPQRIILAGGMSAAGDLLLKPVRRHIEQQCSPILGPPPEVQLAELGNDAGLVGAALGALHAV